MKFKSLELRSVVRIMLDSVSSAAVKDITLLNLECFVMTIGLLKSLTPGTRVFNRRKPCYMGTE